MASLPAFSLRDQSAGERSFPSGRPALLAFVKEDCPTCGTSMPLIEGAHRAFGDGVDVWAVGQEAKGNAALVERYGLTLPMLDDSELGVSFRYDLDTVPTVLLAGADGEELRRFVGFGRDDWRSLYSQLGELSGAAAPAVEWGDYPESEPGCGARNVEPGIAERLEALAEGSPLLARRIEIGSADDPDEFMFDQGFSDGLPVVAPTPERVLRMLGGTRRDAHGVWATTMGASPAMIVNGPIRDRIGMNSGLGAIGQGNRANATIGRALRLVLRNVGGARPGGTERSTLGSPAKFTFTLAEWEERSPWTPLHVDRGYAAEQSVVTLFPAVPGPLISMDQTSRSAEPLAGSLAMSLQAMMHPKSGGRDTLLIVTPEHVDTLWRDGWTKQRLATRLWELTHRPLRELIQDERSGVGRTLEEFGPDGPTEEQLNELIPKFDSPQRLHIVVAGSEAGKITAIFPGWGSLVESRVIEDVV